MASRAIDIEFEFNPTESKAVSNQLTFATQEDFDAAACSFTKLNSAAVYNGINKFNTGQGA